VIYVLIGLEVQKLADRFHLRKWAWFPLV
jgi:hypothetical protein